MVTFKLAPFVAVAPLLLALSACGNPAPTPAVSGTTWRLTALNRDGVTISLVPGREPTMTFLDASTVFGDTGCNRFSGAYALDGATISFDGLIVNGIACEDVNEQEAQFIAALPQKPSRANVTRNGSTLTLTSPDGKTQLVFTAA
jgi:heat shock protein HslJ